MIRFETKLGKLPRASSPGSRRAKAQEQSECRAAHPTGPAAKVEGLGGGPAGFDNVPNKVAEKGSRGNGRDGWGDNSTSPGKA